jgi:hypothetical protein
MEKLYVTHLCQWIFMALQLISPEVTGKWAKSAAYLMHLMALMMFCGMTMKRM